MLRRALHARAITPRPADSAHYTAKLGVEPAYRSRGVGAALLAHKAAAAQRAGRRTFALDVAATEAAVRGLVDFRDAGGTVILSSHRADLMDRVTTARVELGAAVRP